MLPERRLSIDEAMEITMGKSHELGSGADDDPQSKISGLAVRNRLSWDLSPVTILMRYIPGLSRRNRTAPILDHLEQ